MEATEAMRGGGGGGGGEENCSTKEAPRMPCRKVGREDAGGVEAVKKGNVEVRREGEGRRTAVQRSSSLHPECPAEGGGGRRLVRQ